MQRVYRPRIRTNRVVFDDPGPRLRMPHVQLTPLHLFTHTASLNKMIHRRVSTFTLLQRQQHHIYWTTRKINHQALLMAITSLSTANVQSKHNHLPLLFAGRLSDPLLFSLSHSLDSELQCQNNSLLSSVSLPLRALRARCSCSSISTPV